ncbi:uncharacterized protein LOC120281411 isoform X2 [Dioscorea cayenensis subsp. rotundata]|uniref:Uncharacterized protein LOC120281411 isoform X2 n=1 Tax=Dioscorea cayennensis subsp. rotundata TaxID=55577 RepID=A0AB40CW50_DIOCR|nr:uncharacterized protein LOC120281411 isoform X2 [Dioscorea cayenensis subsp. rotundata]
MHLPLTKWSKWQQFRRYRETEKHKREGTERITNNQEKHDVHGGCTSNISMGGGSIKTPLLFQSKLLCLSLLYFLTTTIFSVYISSHSSCLFTSLPTSQSHLPNTLLFSYPPSYGEHKYAIPSLHPSCSSPLLFPGSRDSFAGNFSTEKRRSFFSFEDDPLVQVPCGFLKEFPVKQSDKLEMENCHGVVVASVIFGDFDKIRQPKGLGMHSLQAVCFFMFVDDSTVRGLQIHKILTEKDEKNYKVGVWRIVRLPKKSMPYENDAMNGVIVKHLIHRLFPNSKFSVWIDAKLQLSVDPLLLIHSLLISKDVDMALSKHPFNVHTVQEAMATARWNKWRDVESLRLQMKTYCKNGLQPWSPSKLPHTTDVPDTALIIRRHGLASNLFSCLLFNELEAFNPRDQLAFAYVRDLMRPKIKINMFEVEVFEHIALEYRHNLKREGLNSKESAENDQQIRMAYSGDIDVSGCKRYLLKMWGESSD